MSSIVSSSVIQSVSASVRRSQSVALTATVSLALLLAACPPPAPNLEPPTPALTDDVEDIDFVTPSGSVSSPVSFVLDAPPGIEWVRLTELQGGFTLGDSTDADGGFPLTAAFPLPGLRRVEAIGYDAEGQVVARGQQSFEVVAPPGGRHGLWLHDLASTGLDAGALATRVSDLGVGRLLVRVADGALDCDAVPAGCDSDLTDALRAVGVTPWAVIEAEPNDPHAQADALFDLLPLDYEGLILRGSTRFDGDDDALAALVEAFVTVRGQCVGAGLHTGEFPILANLPAASIDPVAGLVDGWAPEATDADDVAARWCELRGRSDRPIWPVVHAAVSDHLTLDALLLQSGADASVIGVPVAGDAPAWERLEALAWGREVFETPDCE